MAIDPAIRQFVQAWRDRRAQLIGRNRAPLPCTYRPGHPPGRLDDSLVRRTLRRYGKRAGIEQSVHPHSARQTFTATAARARMQLQLDHADLHTTIEFVRRFEPVADLHQFRERDWDEQ